MFYKLRKAVIIFLLLLVLASGCSKANSNEGNANDNEVKLTLAAYTTPREAYAEIIPAFQKYWKDKTGQTVTFEESDQGSGAQSREWLRDLRPMWSHFRWRRISAASKKLV